MYLLCASKKGMSSNQLHRTLGVTLKTAWFMSHRIREAMRSGELAPMGGLGSIVEADETYLWKQDVPRERKTKRYTQPTKAGRSGPAGKRAIISGRARRLGPLVPRRDADKPTVNQIVGGNIEREARVHTDESRIYSDVAQHAAEHERIKHSAGEYVRGDVHTNSVEGFFSIFKRGMHGVYQHCAEKHLHRYLAEYDFRYNHRARFGITDQERAEHAILGIVGKRLTYGTTISEGKTWLESPKLAAKRAVSSANSRKRP